MESVFRLYHSYQCAPPVAVRFMLCYERAFMLSLCGRKVSLIETYNAMAGYLDGWLNIDNIYFVQMFHTIQCSVLQLYKAISSDIEILVLSFNFTYL